MSLRNPSGGAVKIPRRCYHGAELLDGADGSARLVIFGGEGVLASQTEAGAARRSCLFGGAERRRHPSSCLFSGDELFLARFLSCEKTSKFWLIFARLRRGLLTVTPALASAAARQHVAYFAGRRLAQNLRSTSVP